MWQTFLEKNNKRKILFLEYLERARELNLDKKKLQMEMKVSEFVLNSIWEDIEIDLDRFKLSQDLKINVLNGNVILECSGKANSETLARKLAGESLFIQILVSIFNEDSMSLNNFSEQNLVNYPSAHKTLKQLKIYFKKENIEIKKNMVFTANNESHFRLLLVYIFNNLFTNDYSIYDELKVKQIDEYLTQNNHIVAKLRQSQINELKHFLLVTMTRTNRGHLMKKNSELNEINKLNIAGQPKFKGSYSDLLNITTQNASTKRVEKSHLRGFLMSRGWLKESDSQLPLLVEKLTRSFINKMSLEFPKGNSILQSSQELKANLIRIHFQVFLFPSTYNEDYKKLDFKFINEVYPNVFHIVQQYMSHLLKEEQIIEKHKYFLFGEYTFLLINLIPQKSLTETVNLYLDFSFGELYNTYIENNLLVFMQVGLVISNKLDETTDIILTNRPDYLLEKRVEYLVWLTPPRVVDWSTLAELILIIKQRKYHQESRSTK